MILKEQSNSSEKLDPTDLVKRIKLQDKLIEDLKTSNSWRLTAPFRWVKWVLASLFQYSSVNAHYDVLETKDYSEWIKQFDVISASLHANMRDQLDGFAELPLFSILLPCLEPQLAKLDALIVSAKAQIYPNWELCIAVSAQTSAEVRRELARYAQEDSRIRLSFEAQNVDAISDDLAVLCNQALSMVSTQSSNPSVWVLRLNATDLIANKALFMAAKAINESEKYQIIYADEDVLDAQGVRQDPYFKCDWNPVLHLSHNLIGRFGIYSTALMRQIAGYSLGMGKAMDFDLTLRGTECVPSIQIAHLPHVLFHARQGQPSSAGHASFEGVKALDSHFQRININAKAENIGHGYRVHYAIPAEDQPLISLIIPTRNGLTLLRRCITSIQEKTTYKNYEIIIVDNGTDEADTLVYLKNLAEIENIRILRINAPFNYSALNNAAVDIARGELVCLLNNDIEVISPGWLGEMASLALQPNTGVVGACLWYPDETLQHGGVILGFGGVAGHAFAGLGRGQHGYQKRATLAQNFSAVTAACLVIKKSIYQAVEGLNQQDLAVAFNDVDFCLRVREAGYNNVWTPFAELYHHESATRGYENTPEKQHRFAKEMSYMYRRWPKLLSADPAYSPNLTLDGNDFSLAWPPRVPKLEQTNDVQPGVAPLYQRLSTLSKGQSRIAYFAENIHSSTYRYRAANMVEVLSDDSIANMLVEQTSAACFFSSDLKHATQIVKNADLLVISRARYDAGLAELIQAFQLQGKRVLFDIDDLVFDAQTIDLIIKTAGQEASDEVLNYWYSVVGRMSQALRLCDDVVTTNVFLANKIKKFVNLPVNIVPNFVNKAQLTVSEPLYQRKLAHASAVKERIRLGYFSGSASHNGDLALISNALELLMSADARVDLVLVGHVDLEQAFGTRFGGYLKGHLAHRLFLHPLVDFLRLQELIADVDFNLVPLQANDFNNCKSELKYVDAAIVGVRTIASNAYAYEQAIRHGENGYLAADDQWAGVLFEAIANKDTNTEVHVRMASAAYQDVQSRFTWKTQRPAILHALGLS